MPLNLTNSVLTQIAVKRLSGKALVNPRVSIPSENFGSFVQSSNSTIFGQEIPNNPTQTENLIQSASVGNDAGTGTVVYLQFDLVQIGSTYAATVGLGEGDGSAEETVFDNDIGTSATDTYHAYALRLPHNFESQMDSGDQLFATHAGTSISLGSAPFANNYISTGSNKFQLVPEYLSTLLASEGNPIIDRDWETVQNLKKLKYRHV